jgi:hypothetical protein
MASSKPYKRDPAKFRKVINGWNSEGYKGTFLDYANKVGLPKETLRGWLKMAPEFGMEVRETVCAASLSAIRKAEPKQEFTVPALPDDDIDVEEIVEAKKKQFSKIASAAKAARLIQVKVNIEGPIGILHFGDPHLDDDGCDIAAIERHSDLTRNTEGLFGANIGDTTNNWVGRLAHLYSQQNCSRVRAVKLAEWFIRRTKMIYMIGGNHDAWSGDDDPINWIAKNAGTLYKDSQVRIQLLFPKGDPMTINARHDFKGHSIWNPGHGPMKALMMGVRDDLAVAGHRHESAYSVLKDPATGRIGHALKVASYKVYDKYATTGGFRDQALGPCAVTVLRPEMPMTHPDRLKLFWDPEEGADYLTYQRRKGR